MKKSLRFRIAMLTGKAAMFGQKLLGMNATYFPGKLAIRICPDFLGQIEKPPTVLGVTGTNGKTTCCNLLLNILTDQGYDVISNKLGSNIDAGIASTLIGGSSLTGKAKHAVALFEIDERSSKKIYPYIQPSLVLCTNLFRDTVNREAHPEFVFHLISEAMPKETRLIVNGDDLLSSRLAPECGRVCYSIARLPSDTDCCENIVNDMRLCPVCHAPLQYEYVHYHHIGRARCSRCEFASPEAQYKAQVDLQQQTMELEGLGHFSPSVKSKEVTDQKGNTKSSASIHGVNFRCSPRLKEMVKKNAPILVKRENLPKTGIEGRKAKMLSYLERNSYINLTDYAGLNNCTRYRASEDIKQFIKDNVIASVGYRTHRIYVLPEKEDEQN